MELLLITIIVLLLILYLPYLFKTFGLKEIKRSDIPAEGEWAHISDGNIFYRWFHPEIEHRKEEIVILVHGFSTPSFVWGGVIDNFCDSGFEVLIYFFVYDSRNKYFFDNVIHGIYDERAENKE